MLRLNPSRPPSPWGSSVWQAVTKCLPFVFAILWSAPTCQATTILAETATAASPSSANFGDVEVAVSYAAASTQVTGMRFWFAAGLTGPVTATLRDGDGNSRLNVAGVPTRNDGSFTVYEFGFGGALNPRSNYYAGYDFKDASNAVAIGTTTGTTIAFDATLLSNAEYGFFQPDPFDPQSPTFGNYPRFEVVGVPEPSTYAMALAGLACGGYSMFRRRNRA